MPSPSPQIDPPRAPTSSLSAALAPLQEPVFRMLWFTWLTANACLWMNDVAAAWMMTSLTTTPIWVALVATASTLPVFLLGLPSGALADILDRKRFFLMTQLWVALVAVVLSATVFAGVITPAILLALTFANGIGLALRWPVYAAIVPELVARDKLPAALALNGIAMNASRIVGPLIAGALIASFGSAYVFLLNAVLSLLAAIAISRWQRKVQAPPLGPEKLLGAIRVGLQFAGQSVHLKGILVLISLFFFHSTALLALLPLVARGLQGGGAGTYTLKFRNGYNNQSFSFKLLDITAATVLTPETLVSGNVNLGLDGVTAQIAVDALDLNLAKDPAVAAGQIVPRLDWTRAFDLNGNNVYGDAGDLLNPGAELPTPVNLSIDYPSTLQLRVRGGLTGTGDYLAVDDDFDAGTAAVDYHNVILTLGDVRLTGTAEFALVQRSVVADVNGLVTGGLG